MRKLIYFSIAIALITCGQARGQFIEDALRLSQHNSYITARAGGLNVAFHGISDDYGALYYNPAGLSLAAKSEFSIGFGFTTNATETDFLKSITEFSSNDAYITHAGILVPFKVESGNASIGIGYMLENNFDRNSKFNAFNASSSIIDFYARSIGSDKAANFPYQLFLTDENFNTPLKGNLNQSGFVQEKGGMHNVTGGAGFDLSELVALGFTITGKWGTYSYRRDYTEEDTRNFYNEYDSVNFTDLDFRKMDLVEELTQDISGITGSIGLQFRLEDFMRFGVGVKFPTYFEVTEDFSQQVNVQLDNGKFVYLENQFGGDSVYTNMGSNSYKVTTPFVYSAGFSVHASNLTFTAGVEYSDVSQLEFSDAISEVRDLNQDIVEQLVGQTSWGFGVEYDVPLVPIVVRGSYSSTTSPYAQDIANASLKTVSFGGGIYLAKNVRLDGLFRWSNISELRSVYGNTQYIYKISPVDIGMSITYRY